MPEGNIHSKKNGEAQLEQLENPDEAKMNDFQETTQANIMMDELFYGENHDYDAESPIYPNTEINIAEINRGQS